MIGGKKHDFFKSKKAEEHKKKIKAKTVRLDRRSGAVLYADACALAEGFVVSWGVKKKDCVL